MAVHFGDLPLKNGMEDVGVGSVTQRVTLGPPTAIYDRSWYHAAVVKTMLKHTATL